MNATPLQDIAREWDSRFVELRAKEAELKRFYQSNIGTMPADDFRQSYAERITSPSIEAQRLRIEVTEVYEDWMSHGEERIAAEYSDATVPDLGLLQSCLGLVREEAGQLVEDINHREAFKERPKSYFQALTR